MKEILFEHRYPYLKETYYIYNKESNIVFRVYVNGTQALVDVDRRYDTFKKCGISKDDFEILWKSSLPVWDFLFEFSYKDLMLDYNDKKTMILKVSPNRYIYIGNQIFEFITLDPILYYKDSNVMTKNDILDLIERVKYTKEIKTNLYAKIIYS